jgi:ribosomal protein L37E
MTILQQFVFDNLASLIAEGGEAVDQKTFEHRKSVCAACPLFGEVTITTPITSFKMPGCTKCGCPTATKARMKLMKRLKGNAEVPLSASELGQKALGIGEFELVYITCPHPDGDKWAI